MPDTRDEKERVRERVAAEHGIQLYRRYGERQAAETIGWNYATLKRKRRAGLVPLPFSFTTRALTMTRRAL